MPENARTPSKNSQVAPIISAQHTPRRDDTIIETKKNLKPAALASEVKFPTLEGLAEEKGIEIEQQAIGSEENYDEKAAWQGKLPSAVKKDGEFTQADVIFIDETAEREAELAADREAEREAMDKELESKIIAVNSAAERKAQEKKKTEQASEKETRASMMKQAADQHEKQPPANVTSRHEPTVEQKKAQQPQKPDALAPAALKSEAKFPTLEGLAEEKGIEIEQQPVAKAEHDEKAAWQGKLPAAVKKDGEFTEADVIFIDETAEREAELAADREAEREAMAKELESKIIAVNSAAERKAREKKEAEQASEKEALAERKAQDSKAKAAKQPEAKPLANEKANIQPQAKPKANDAASKPAAKLEKPQQPASEPQAKAKAPQRELEIIHNAKSPLQIVSNERFPTAKDLSKDKGIEIKHALSKAPLKDSSNHSEAPSKNVKNQPEEKPRKQQPLAWKGELPEAEKKQDSKAEVHFENEPADKDKALNKGLFRWFKGEPRETGLERFFVRCASGILGFGLSIACGFLGLFGLRDLSGRLIMGSRNLADNIVEGTFLRHFRNYGHQWWMYRLPVRVVRNIDRNVREHIGPEPGKDVEDKVNQVHREASSSLETAKKEFNRLRGEANEVIGEARERIRQTAADAKKK